MNLERYQYLNSNDYHDYEFWSEGPKGRIRKMVTFSRIPNTDPAIYNLAFGDLNSITGELDDTVISNNEDRQIVLATVANTIAEFCDRHGNHYIYAKGSTASRTRLYQMGITSLWEEISMDFEVYGLKDDDWKEFAPNSFNYGGFLVKRK
ncbi:hypothetical protein BDE36_0417 [Arcticibacter tournemirensis]|uniref:Uncharacterized protein n=1 Tax=Arcticibacter tournemirensis TaxID=699437 RepID=A0A5M9HJL5_9SPHI|nr:hypothetical protein [Arcticibacter tournemirensis]KAA8485558.1 hypothetical protein F1649_03495 [Arcticibacter tournemirensis]TQM48727.1 hypothetical protein BDE36_0417 [Arcticibacter tournemirensis]